MKIRARLTALVALVLALAPALPAASDPLAPPISATALGNEGQLYELLAGTFGELFPEDPRYAAETPILALDVVDAEGARERILVPGTEGPEVEGSPSVVFEDASRRLYAVWESKRTPAVSRLLLAEYIPAGWSEPLEISGDVSPLKDAPQVLITRDRFAFRNAAGEQATRSRTVIHVVWLEEGADGKAYYYTPVILDAGRYIGWNPVVALAELEPDEPATKAAAETLELLRAPELAAGQDVQSTILGFLSPGRNRLLTVEARLLPGELGFLADEIRADIIEIGARDRDELQAVAKKFREDARDVGHRLNGGVVGYFADRAYASILERYDAQPDRSMEGLADDIRADIIEIGRELFGGPRGNAKAAAKLVEVMPMGIFGGHDPAAPPVSHLVRLQVVMDRPAPPLGDAPARVFVSEDGERALVGWLSRGKVYYTETSSETPADEGAWTEVKHLTLTDELDGVTASRILESRVRRPR